MDLFGSVLWGAAAMVAVVSVVGFFGRYWWLFDVLSHLRTQYAIGAGAVAVLALVAGEPLAAGLALIVALANTILVLPQLPGRQRPLARKQAMVRVLFANVLEKNEQFERLAVVIDEADADIVVLAEVDADAIAQVRLRLPQYPFFAQPAIGPRPLGIGLLSKVIPRSSRLVDLGESGSQLVIARFDDAAGGITVIGAHPLPPHHPSWFRRRDAYLRKLAALVREEHSPVVLVGDFNLTPWAAQWGDFLEASGLRDSRSGFGLQTTWPAPLPPLLRIPIDHCFVSEDLVVVSRCVLGSTGSDHLPIAIDVSERRTAEEEGRRI